MIRPRLLSLAAAALLALPAPRPAPAQEALGRALSLAAREEWDAALAAAEADGAVARDLIEWQRLRAGEARLGDYEGFLARRPDWPGLPLIRREGETAVARSDSPDRVVAWFGDGAPQTGTGSVALIRALRSLGRAEEARAEARRAWRDLALTAPEEEALLSLYGGDLAALNEARLDRLLWDGDVAGAERMLPRVGPGWRALGRARLALAGGGGGVDALVEAVPDALRDDPGLAQARFVWRIKNDLEDEAAALILDRSADPARLGRPEAWAVRRAGLARALLRAGEPETAYRVAASHRLTAGVDYADLEFLAGFAALRHLGDAELALGHFRALEAAVKTPISLTRALYWQGRTLEVMGRAAEAAEAYRAAARYQTAYYGLLAAERLGMDLDASLLSEGRPSDWRGAAFARSSVLEAALLALRAGDRPLARRFVQHLAQGLDDAQLAQLGDMALALDQPHLAVVVAKQAAERGLILPGAYFPVTDLVPDGLPVSRALALSIARRESEFDPTVRSPAGARGLMQVMPETGRLMARELVLPFEPGRLTSDPGFNATIGSAYLAKLVDEFGPSVALVASGYNAGPGRPRRWITEFGDPRREDVDVVDWVETIPFTETRTYVMRVVESLVIYLAKLRGQAGPVRITAELKG